MVNTIFWYHWGVCSVTMGGFYESLAVLPYSFDQGALLKYVAGMEFYIRAEKLIVLWQFHQEKMNRLVDSKGKLELERLQHDTEDESGVREVYVAVNPRGKAPFWGIYHDQCYI